MDHRSLIECRRKRQNNLAGWGRSDGELDKHGGGDEPGRVVGVNGKALHYRRQGIAQAGCQLSRDRPCRSVSEPRCGPCRSGSAVSSSISSDGLRGSRRFVSVLATLRPEARVEGCPRSHSGAEASLPDTGFGGDERLAIVQP
jgi:hypothetical protein